jgi:hypothetical protein
MLSVLVVAMPLSSGLNRAESTPPACGAMECGLHWSQHPIFAPRRNSLRWRSRRVCRRCVNHAAFISLFAAKTSVFIFCPVPAGSRCAPRRCPFFDLRGKESRVRRSVRIRMPHPGAAIHNQARWAVVRDSPTPRQSLFLLSGCPFHRCARSLARRAISRLSCSRSSVSAFSLALKKAASSSLRRCRLPPL